MKKELITHKDPKAPISEIFRTLRTNIQFMNTKNKLQVLLVTSALPSEGKSWVTSNLAITFAQAGKRVILVDADMRKGRQFNIFGCSPTPGLSNYLSLTEEEIKEKNKEEILDYIQETSIQNLYVMVAGNVPPNPSELLISSRMIHLLEELKQLCDIVIIDGTPIELVTDSLILARLVDSTVVVTACKQTKREDLKKVVSNIQNVGGNIVGIVVNKVPNSNKKYEQNYYYGLSLVSSNKKNNGIKRKNILKEENLLKQNIEKEQDAKVSADQEELELPNVLQMNSKQNQQNVNSVKNTDNIIEQINDYINKEKKNIEEKGEETQDD